MTHKKLKNNPTEIDINQTTPTFEVHLDTRGYKQKPSKDQAAGVSKRIAVGRTQTTLHNLVLAIEAGHAWTPAVFKEGKRTKQTWESQQILSLDFDTGDRWTDVLEKLIKDGFEPTFIYTTFSHKEEHHKFRVVWLLEEALTDPKAADYILKKLLGSYCPTADKSALEIARLNYGGKSVVHFNPSAVLTKPKFEMFLNACNACYVKVLKANKNQGREKVTFPGIGYINIYSRSTNESSSKAKTPEPNTGHGLGDSYFVENYDFDTAVQHCRILKDFSEGKYLHHNELFGLATSLIHIKGGESWYLAKLAGTDNDRDGKDQLCGIARRYDYQPMLLENYSPYPEDHTWHNLLEVGKRYRHPVRLPAKEGTKLMTVTEAQIKVKEALHAALRGTKSVVIKAPTGIGKSELLKDIKDVVLAFPTHQLKEEFAKRRSDRVMQSQEIPESISDKDRAQLEHLYKVGSYTRARKLLKELSVKNPDVAAYLKNFNAIHRTSQTLLTTHSMCFWSGFENHSTIIFDEDPLRSMLEIKSVKSSDLDQLIRASESGIISKKDGIVIHEFTKAVATGLPNSPKARPNFSFEDYSAIERFVAGNREIDSCVLGLFAADAYAITAHEVDKFAKGHSKDLNVHYIQNRSGLLLDLKKHKRKFIVLSATANEFIYRRLFGDDIEFLDFSDVQLKGLLRQHTEYSFSRASLCDENDRKKQIIDEINETGKPVITFQEHKKHFENAIKEMHHGNVLGYDTHKGQDLVIVGTPHIHPVTYLLYAHVLNIRTEPADFVMHDRLVEYGGFRFTFRTYQNEDLRILQFYHIEEGLLQAVGRARLLRENCRVDVYSNFPLKHAAIDSTEEELRQQQIEQQLSIIEEAVLESRDMYVDDKDHSFDTLNVSPLAITLDRVAQTVEVVTFNGRRATVPLSSLKIDTKAKGRRRRF